MSSLYDSGIRPVIDNHLARLAEEKRDYGDYWSASSAGYCYRRLIFERLNIPYVTEDARKQRVFSSGDIFHEWIQGITKEAGLSIAQELELQDENLMVRGHVDDLVLIPAPTIERQGFTSSVSIIEPTGNSRLILYDYKTAHSKWFEYAKTRPVSYYNKMQVGTYMYMARKGLPSIAARLEKHGLLRPHGQDLTEARVLKISKDDLRLFEYQVLWTPELEKEVKDYWLLLGDCWLACKIKGILPPCTCHEHENGFLAKEAYNNYFYEGEPCSEAWFRLNMKERVAK